MIGAILGDMIGSPYEFDGGDKSKDFDMFNNRIRFTDDSVMTIAVADAVMNAGMDAGRQEMKDQFVKSMQKWGRRYPNAGFGGMFSMWLLDEHPEPYGSFGNGSAMRVSSVGWFFDSLERTREVARWSAEVTHNHAEGVLGAEAAATVIYLARTGYSKEKIKEYVIEEFGYDLSQSCDEIRQWYRFDVTCQGTVPPAITAFLEGKDFEDVIRTAVSLGGDCDTLTCIAGGMAEALYGVPEHFVEECESRLPEDIITIIKRFQNQIGTCSPICCPIELPNV